MDKKNNDIDDFISIIFKFDFSKNKRRKLDLNDILNGTSINEVINQQFIKIHLITVDGKVMGDPLVLAIQRIKEKVKNIMQVLSIKKKFSISLFLSLNMLNKKRELFLYNIQSKKNIKRTRNKRCCKRYF